MVWIGLECSDSRFEVLLDCVTSNASRQVGQHLQLLCQLLALLATRSRAAQIDFNAGLALLHQMLVAPSLVLATTRH